MPQATRELQLRWNHDEEMDSKALKHLQSRGYTFRAGLILAPIGAVPTEDDYSAIDYLCQEWDYGWEGPRGA